MDIARAIRPPAPPPRAGNQGGDRGRPRPGVVRRAAPFHWRSQNRLPRTAIVRLEDPGA